MKNAGLSYKEILLRPLQQVRRSVAQSFLSGKLDKSSFHEAMNDLRSVVSERNPGQLEEFERQLSCANTFIETGVMAHEPKADNSTLQLLWGSALATVSINPNLREGWQETEKDKPISQSSAWEAIRATQYIKTESHKTRIVARKETLNSKITTGFQEPQDGYPAVAYYFNSEANYINEDLVWGLIGGIEHMRSVVMHEIAHGQGSRNISPAMKALRKKMEELDKTRKDWGTAEKIEYAKMATEWKLRFMFYDEAENSYANQFAANAGEHAAQNYAHSLGFFEALIVGHDQKSESGENKPATNFERFLNIKKAVRYGWHLSNGFFNDDRAGWESVGVDWDMLGLEAKRIFSGEYYSKRTQNEKIQYSLNFISSFCASLANSQPSAEDRLYGDKYFADLIQGSEKQRLNEVDGTFKQWVEPLLPKIMQEVEQKQQQIIDMMDAIQQGIENGEIVLIDGMPPVSLDGVPGETPDEEKGIPQDVPKEEIENSKEQKGMGTPSDAQKKGDVDTSQKTPSIEGDGSLSNYMTMVGGQRSTIKKLTRLFIDLKQRFFDQRDEISSQRDFTGDLANLDVGSLHDRLVAQHTGGQLQEDDFAHINREAPQRQNHPKPQIDIFIDTSGSMRGDKLKIAIMAAINLYKGGEGADFDVNIATLGGYSGKHLNISMDIANPGEAEAVIGRRIDALLNRKGVEGDHIVPAFRKALSYVTGQERANKIVGNSHVVIISDTGFCDGSEQGSNAMNFVETVARKCKHMTMDFVIVDNQESEVIPVIKRINKMTQKGKANYRHISDVSELGKVLVSLVKDRLNVTQEADGILFSEKQEEFRKAEIAAEAEL